MNYLEDKTALMVMVHGSPRPVANIEMYNVVEMVRARGVFPIIQVGFMECNEPTIPDAIDACIAQGANRVIAVPYFLHVGTHVADDLPSLVEEAQVKYPQVSFEMGQYLGMSPALTDVLRERAASVAGS